MSDRSTLGDYIRSPELIDALRTLDEHPPPTVSAPPPRVKPADTTTPDTQLRPQRLTLPVTPVPPVAMSTKTPDELAAEELLAQLLSSKAGADLLNLQAGSAIFKITEPEDKVELAPDTPLTKRPARRATITSLHKSAAEQLNRESTTAGSKTFAIPETQDPPPQGQRVKTAIIGGREMKIRSTPNDASLAQRSRMWDKTKRDGLTVEAQALFLKSATNYVLDKGNKLSLPPERSGNDLKLTSIRNLESQLFSLKQHMINHDIDDVFTVVTPALLILAPPAIWFLLR